MRINLSNNNKVIILKSNCGNSYIYISKVKFVDNTFLYSVSLTTKGKFAVSEHPRLIIAYNNCVGDIFNQLPLNVELDAQDDFIAEAGCFMEILSK